MRNNKKKFFGAITSKKLALLLSTSALILPLTSCKNVNDKPNNEKPKIELCDTSDISADKILEEYVANYESGNISYIVDKLDDYIELYENLRLEQVTEESTNVTYNFDGTAIPFDRFENGYYYVGEDAIKYIDADMVRLKNLNGDIQIENADGVCSIKNNDEKNAVKTIITYSSDKSCKITEEEKQKTKTLEFDNNGSLIYSIYTDKDNFYEKKVYTNGNVNVYEQYDKNENMAEKRNTDGSYVIYSHKLDKNIYDYDFNCITLDSVNYYYDKDSKLQYIDVYDHSKYNNGDYSDYRAKLMPNGDTYKYTKRFDKNGELILDEKIESKYNKYMNTIKITKDDDGNEHTLVLKYDYTKICPEKFFGENIIGDLVYEKKDNMVYKEEKDGIIYCYSHYNKSAESFYEAYKVGEKEITYYREDGTRLRTIDKNRIETSYNEQGKIDSIQDNKTKTSYYDYEKNVVNQISNVTGKNISIEVNGETYDLGKNGYVSFYENGDRRVYCKDENYYSWYYENGGEYEKIGNDVTIYDKERKIKCTERNKIVTNYYDYDSNSIKSIKVDGVERSYYETGELEKITNVENEDSQQVNGYELAKGSYISYYENGNVNTYYRDKNSYYSYYEQGAIKKVAEDGTITLYDENNNITDIWTGVCEGNSGIHTRVLLL